MRLKRETAVAIAILVACARSNDCRLKTVEAAKAANTSTDFAAHIALRLVNAGFLKAKRGRGGGLKLSRTAETIYLGELMAGLEACGSTRSDKIAVSASLEDEASDLNEIIAGANYVMRTFLDRFSIADLADRQVNPCSNRIQRKSAKDGWCPMRPRSFPAG